MEEEIRFRGFFKILLFNPIGIISYTDRQDNVTPVLQRLTECRSVSGWVIILVVKCMSLSLQAFLSGGVIVIV